MAAQRNARTQLAETKQPGAYSEPIKPREVAKVYKALGLDNDEGRRRYLDWYEGSRPEPEANFEVIERGDTRSFD